MMFQLSQHQLTTEEDLPLRLDLRLPTEMGPRGIVVVVHGFKGFKDWGFFPWVGEQLAEVGWASVCFDFSCNGVGERPGEFDRLDLFERNTYAREVSDLARVLRWCREEAPLTPPLRQGPKGLLAHSRGALSAVVAAVEEDDVEALVTWNGVAHALRWTDRQMEEWQRQGRLEFVNSRTKQKMAVGYALVEDARAQAARYDLASQAMRMRAAHLILHAAQDLAVDPSEAETLRAERSEDQRCRLHLVENTGHTFHAVHPFAGSTAQLEFAMKDSLEWFEMYLGDQSRGG